MDESLFVAGGISGAITDPYSDEAEKHAEMYYEEIRHMTTDVERIAKNIGYSKEQILLIKNYLFIDVHALYGGTKRFDCCFEIAESWRRLAFAPNDIQEHDLILVKHELTEISLVSQGLSQDDAHDNAEKLYNYQKASRKFYENLALNKK